MVLFVIAAVAVIAGFVALGNLSPANPVSVPATTARPSTTTTVEDLESPIDVEDFSVAQIATGQPMDWEVIMSLDDGYPLQVVDYRGDIYLFTSDRPRFAGVRRGGLRAWRSGNGVDWEPLGQIIPETHSIVAVASTVQGLLALEPGPPGAGFSLWHSFDGETWEVEEAPMDLGDHVAFSPMSVAANQDLIAVSGYTAVDVSGLMEDAAGGSPTYGWAVDVLNGEIQISLIGPGGFQLAVVTADELGLSEGQRQAITESFYEASEQNDRILIRDGTEWHEAHIEGVNSVRVVDTDGEGHIMAGTFGPVGFQWWATEDGTEWVGQDPSANPPTTDDWGGRPVGPSPLGDASLVLATEAGDWERIGPADHFPNDLDWGITAFGAGPGGVAAIITAWGSPSGAVIEDAEPPTLSSEGATLTLDYEEDHYVLTKGTDVYRWPMSEATPAGISIDLEAGSLLFDDPETGEHLASFDLRAIDEAASSFWSQGPVDAGLEAFAFTNDAEQWLIQDVAALGDPARVALLEVTGDHVVAVSVADDWTIVAPQTPGMRVWAAEIP